MFKLRLKARTAKSCAVYFKDDACYVISHVMTNHGRVTKDPMVKLAQRASILEIGEAVLGALEAFEEVDGLPEPDHLENFLHFVGARSWREFARDNLHISVEFDGKEISLTPTRADDRGAFLYDNAPSICPSSPEIVGKRVLYLAESN